MRGRHYDVRFGALLGGLDLLLLEGLVHVHDLQRRDQDLGVDLDRPGDRTSTMGQAVRVGGGIKEPIGDGARRWGWG